MPEAPGAEAVEELVALEVEEVASEAEESRRRPTVADHGAGTRLAGRIGHHATAYGLASIAGVVSGLVGVVVFTRFLSPGEFGKMAVLSTLSTIITMIATLGIMQGTMRRVYGTTGDDDAGDLAEGVDRASVAADPRLALTTGLALSLVFSAALLLLAVALHGTVADLLGGPDDGVLLLLAAGAGAAGGVMRFAQNILRLQLRSGAYLVVTLIYAFAGIPVAIPLLEAGMGIEAILIGFIVANLLSGATCLALLVADLRPAVSLREAGQILRSGVTYLPLSLSFQMVQMGDTLLVATFGGFSQTGVYRVAQRIAMPISFGTSVFQQSWGPLKRDMTQIAVDRLDEERVYVARLFTYYGVFVTALILTVAVLANPLARLASGEFGEAATIVPLTALSVAGHGWFIFAYRNSHLPRHMLWMVVLSILCALLFVASSVVLIPILGAVGAPVAAIGSWGLVTVVMLVANQLIGQPIPYERRNLLLLGAASLAVWAIAFWLLPDSGLGLAAKLLLLLGWAAALFFAGIVPMREVRALGRFLRDATGIDSRRRLRARLDALDGTDALLVDELVCRRRSPADAAERTGLSEEEAMSRTVHALRLAAGGAEAKETDAQLGALLLQPIPRSERDNGLMKLVADGADPLDADLIKRALTAGRNR